MLCCACCCGQRQIPVAEDCCGLYVPPGTKKGLIVVSSSTCCPVEACGRSYRRTKHLPLQLDPGLPDGPPQVIRVDNNTSTTLILNTGAPQGCVLSPLLYSLFTHNCMARHDSNTIIKFADDTTVVGLITDNDETAYREEVRVLVGWCQNNNLSLNVIKTKEMIVDYRKRPSTSLGLSCLPSRTIPGSVRGRPEKLSKPPATPVIDCSLCYRMANGIRAPSPVPKGFSTAFTPKP